MKALPKVKHIVGRGVRAGLKKAGYDLVTHVEPVLDPDPFPVDAWTDDAYSAWFEAHRATDEELARQRAAASSFQIKPTFSFIVPLFRTPLDYLRDVVESVLAQTYGNLELVLVNASPENKKLAQAVEGYRLADRRVVVVQLEDNYGITRNTDFGARAASGDFLCFLDHDDFIEPDLLFEYVKAINAYPNIDFLYCDEDMVQEQDDVIEQPDDEEQAPSTDEDAEGVVSERKLHHLHPLFKPAFSPELLLCKNYIIHLLTIRRALYMEMVVPVSSFDGSQDYNLTLATVFSARYVHHVPKVLYHWRINVNSTATNPDSKPYGHTSNRWAIEGHIKRRGIDATVIASGIPFLHNLWFKPGDAARVSLVIPTERDLSRTETLIKLLLQTNSYSNIELVVVGANAQGLSLEIPNLQLVSDVPAECTLLHAWNLGALRAHGDFVVFMPCGSMFLTAEPLEQLLGMQSILGVGAAAPKTLYQNGENKCYGIAITKNRVMPLYRGYDDSFPGYQCNLRAFQNPSAVSYEGMMTPRELFLAVGGFDERFEGAVAAADYCVRIAQAGFRCVQTPTVKLLADDRCPFPRYDYATSTQDYTEADQNLFYEKWPAWRVTGDPFYNGNLDQMTGYQQVPHE